MVFNFKAVKPVNPPMNERRYGRSKVKRGNGHGIPSLKQYVYLRVSVILWCKLYVFKFPVCSFYGQHVAHMVVIISWYYYAYRRTITLL